MVLDRLTERLKETPHPIAEIARRAGVSRGAVLAIRDGDTDSPRIKTFQAISGALDQLDEEAMP
jgi:transcriptional regulator with XRE-family HTH domain